MSILAMFKGKGPSGFGYGSTAEEVTEGVDLNGRRILVTGCNSGLGYETMRVLALRGATVVGVARSIEKATEACSSVQGRTVPVACELSEPASIRACVAEVVAQGEPLHAIIANAGIMALPTAEQLFGYEKQFFTNHVGHFMLVTGILDLLASDGRVVMLSSAAHKGAPRVGIEFDNLSGERDYAPWRAYGQAKLANMLFARELARRFDDTGKVANAVHPGVIATNLSRHMNPLAVAAFALGKPLVLKNVGQGAATEVWAAAHPHAGRINGQYLADCNISESTPQGRDPVLASRLWEVTEQIVLGLPA